MSVSNYRASESFYFPVILNSTNLVSSNANLNQYRYTFPTGAITFSDSSIAVSNVQIFYSWYNISASAGNNSYTLVFLGTPYVITMPSGYYSVSSLNEYLQQQMVANNLYLINSTGEYVYYAEYLENSTYYSIQLNCYPVPTSLPVGWSNPGIVLPGTAETPQITIAANAFRDIIGFAAGTFPSVVQATTYSALSTSTPAVTPVSSVLLTCSLVNNRYSIPGTILYSFTAAGVGYGNLIDSAPSEYSFVSIQDGNYTSFDITFLDQSFNPLVMRDSNVCLTFLIKNRLDKY